MAETVVLAAPITKPNRTAVSIRRIAIDVASKSLTIEWVGDDGEPGTAYYPTPSVTSAPSGQTLLATLNKMNFSGGNPSLVSRVMTRLITDGLLPAGSITGTPD